jgi:hypothetical protein
MTGFIGTWITITINCNSSQLMTVSDSLHSLLDYECLLFCVTDLVLIHEPVTSSASVVRWLALHSWTLDFSRMKALLQLNRFSLQCSLYRLPAAMENVCCHGNVLTETLASNGIVRCCVNVCLESRWTSVLFVAAGTYTCIWRAVG